MVTIETKTIAMAKSKVLERFLRSGYFGIFPRAVEDILHVKPSIPRSYQKHYFGKRQPKFLKGVGRDGNYYRLNIPLRKRLLPDIPKLPKGQNTPQPLTAPPIRPESAADIKGYKRKLLKWLQANLPVLILNFGRYVTCMHRYRIDCVDWQVYRKSKGLSIVILIWFCFLPSFPLEYIQYVHIACLYSIRYFGASNSFGHW